MANSQAFLSRAGFLLSALLLLSIPAGLTNEPYGYQFQDKEGNTVNFPADVPLFWKERPGPWKSVEAAHDVTIKTHARRQGLEMSRVINIRVSHDAPEGYIKAIYVLDKDKYVVGYSKFKEKSGPDLETEVEITSVINYVEICVECSRHGMWKKIYRFV